MKRSLLLFVIITGLVTEGFTRVFESTHWDAAAAGIGGAKIAAVQDASALEYNPAGLGSLEQIQLFFNQSRPFTGIEMIDINDFNFSVSVPLKQYGAFGLGETGTFVPNLYNEYMIMLGYGLVLGNVFEVIPTNYIVGITAKFLNYSIVLESYSRDDPLFSNGSSRSAFTFDFGFAAKRLVPGLDMGITLRNINEPNLGFAAVDPLYREYGAGVSYTIGEPGEFMGWLFSIDGLVSEVSWNVMGGAELSLIRRLLLIRAGANVNELTIGLGTSLPIIKKIHLDFNYAFLLPMGIQGSFGTHQFSLLLKF